MAKKILLFGLALILVLVEARKLQARKGSRGGEGERRGAGMVTESMMALAMAMATQLLLLLLLLRRQLRRCCCCTRRCC